MLRKFGATLRMGRAKINSDPVFFFSEVTIQTKVQQIGEIRL